jgi:hypothetical protein
MEAMNQVGIGLSYRPASLCSLATQFQTRFLESTQVHTFYTVCDRWGGDWVMYTVYLTDPTILLFNPKQKPRRGGGLR